MAPKGAFGRAPVPEDSEGAALKYLCLVYVEESRREMMSRDDYAAMAVESLDYIEELKASRHHVAAEPLEPVATAVTVRVRNGEVSMIDGPFAETKEQLGGFFMIEARDLNEALAIAARIPPARIGSIEVRAVRDLSEYVESARRRSTNQ